MLGGRAAREAVQTLADLGLDLSGHETQPLTEPLVRHADVIFTMTRCHREAIVAQWPSAAERTMLLSTGEVDICDPIGSPVEQYRRCAAQIGAELELRVRELELPIPNP
jgi:protein-tyrosine-phosphatase